MMLKMTLMHKQREMGRVMRMRSAERQVRTKAQGPGPSGSAENLLMIFSSQKVKVDTNILGPSGSAESVLMIFAPQKIKVGPGPIEPST